MGIVIMCMFATGGNTFSKVSQLTSARRCFCKTDCPIKVKENRTRTICVLLPYEAVRRFKDVSSEFLLAVCLVLEDYSRL